MAQQQSINASQHQIIMPVLPVNNVKTETTSVIPTLVNVQSYVVANAHTQGTVISQQQIVNTPTPNVQQFNSIAAKPTPVTTSASANASLPAQSANEGAQQLLSKPRLMELVRDVDSTVQLDDEVEEMLLGMADDFMESIMSGACKIAKHRHASTVEVRDVQLYLEKAHNMWIPGLGTDELRPYKRSAVTDAHKQRMALIRKAKKY